MNNLHKISWDDSIWFSDVDDTLINTADLTPVASEGIRKVFKARFGNETAEKIQYNFNETFRLLMLGLRSKTDKGWNGDSEEEKKFTWLWNEVEKYQEEIKSEFGAVKKFSREVFIKIATDKLGIVVNPELIYEAADAYWITLSEKCQLLPGVIELVQEIKKHRRPLYLVTSSDARLKLKPNGQFEYTPEYSENFKRQRIQLLREKGLDFNTVSIGDPEDKPHLDFFEKGVKTAEADLDRKIDLRSAVFMGDSFPADIQTPKEKMGFGLVVLLEQGRETTEIIDEHQVNTGNLAEISKLLVN